MKEIERIFWNSNQRRLRTLWRLIGQILIFIVILIVIGGPVAFITIGMLIAQEGISADQLSDPWLVVGFIRDNPMLMMLNYAAQALSAIISVWLAGRFLDQRRFVDFGLHFDRNWWIDFGFGLLLGAVLMLTIFLFEFAAGWVTVTGTFVTNRTGVSFLPGILTSLVAFVAVGFYEELLFRGYELQNQAEGLTWNAITPTAAILIATLFSSTAFGIYHIFNPNASAISTLYILFAGLMLAAGYVLTGELAIPIALHIAWNFFQGNVFGFPVSGTTIGSATLLSIEQRGPDRWTGGAFGPEGGFLGLGAMALGILLTFLWVRWRYGETDFHLELAQPPARLQETE